jgi:hypothetical protein
MQVNLAFVDSTTLQCMRLADHATLNSTNKMSRAAVFLDIEKAFDTLWHPGLLYKTNSVAFSPQGNSADRRPPPVGEF